jgi:hypothetical protein
VKLPGGTDLNHRGSALIEDACEQSRWQIAAQKAWVKSTYNRHSTGLRIRKDLIACCTIHVPRSVRIVKGIRLH